MHNIKEYPNWLKARERLILIEMISSPYIRTPLLALVLPMALMWVFAGCVFSCSELCGAALEHPTVSAESRVDDDNCLDCPFVNAPFCGLPGRCAWRPHPSDNAQSESLLGAGLDSSEVYSVAALPKPPDTTDPPPLRFSVLRI